MKIGYSKTYPLLSSGCFEKIWLEDEIEFTDMEAVRQAQYALKKQVENFHYESNKAAEKQAQIQEDNDTPKSQEDKIIAQIKTMKDLKSLESYKLLSRTYPGIQTAYNEKLKELSNGH